MSWRHSIVIWLYFKWSNNSLQSSQAWCKDCDNSKPLYPHWNSLVMSTLHHQPLWLSLRNTNQLKAPHFLSRSLSFLSVLLTLSHAISCSLSFSVFSLLLTENKCCITILIQAWVCRFRFLFFSFLARDAQSEQQRAAQSQRSGVWILMTSTRRKWGESALNLSFSPLCLSLSPMGSCLQLVYIYRICLSLILIN